MIYQKGRARGERRTSGSTLIGARSAGSSCWLVTLCFLLMVFFGCASNKTIPITKEVIREVGVNNTPEFQYYVSTTITLKLVERKDKTTIENGKLVRRKRTVREQITIQGNLPGIVRRHDTRTTPDPDGFKLQVAFEDYSGNPCIWFGQYLEGDDEKYFILYNDDKNFIIQYGNDNYVVSFEGEDAPYLLIKMNQSVKASSKERKAGGLKLRQ
jgi:hypothetical protein